MLHKWAQNLNTLQTVISQLNMDGIKHLHAEELLGLCTFPSLSVSKLFVFISRPLKLLKLWSVVSF